MSCLTLFSDSPPRVAPKMTTGMIEEGIRKRPPGTLLEMQQ